MYSKIPLILFLYFAIQHRCSSIQQVNVNDCGKSKGCFFHPAECKSAIQNCTVAATYSSKNDQSVEFELIARVRIQLDGQGQYIALGYSDDKSMGDDSVTHCLFVNNSPTKNSVGVSYNKKGQHENEPVGDGSTINGVATLTESGQTDNALICRFVQKVRANVKDDRMKPLNSDYYLFLTTGSADLKTGRLLVHNTDHQSRWFPAISSTKINVANKDYKILV